MDSTDEEDFWDEIEVPLPPGPIAETVDVSLADAVERPLEFNIEITLPRKGVENREKRELALAKRQATARDRHIRLQAHKLHTVALLSSLSIRNKWLSDRVLQARLLSLIPLPIQHSFTSIRKSTHPDPARRGRLFETALVHLVHWFAPISTQNPLVERTPSWFRITNSGHIKSHTFEAGSQRIQVLEKREAERKIRRAKHEERRAKRARARIKGKGKARQTSDSSSDLDDSDGSDSEDEWYAPESLRSPNSIAKHALQRSGSRDMAALVFVAIVRSLGIPARLVASLQSVSWVIPKDYSKKSRQRNDKVVSLDQHPPEDNVEMEEVIVPGASSGAGTPDSTGVHSSWSISTPRTGQPAEFRNDNFTHLNRPVKRKYGAQSSGTKLGTAKGAKTARQDDYSGDKGSSKAGVSKQGNDIARGSSSASSAPPAIKLRRSKPTGNVLGSASAPIRDGAIDESHSTIGGPPTLWAEVFSRPDGRWMPVDPVRGIVNRAGVFEERDALGRRKAGKIMYVVALEEDGYARDVTARYAKNFGAHQVRARARVAISGRNGKAEWWNSVINILKRPYALHRDDVEDAELSLQRAAEGLPTSISAFKDHPIYALERHLRKDEAIYPRTEIAHFRGEPVFPRQNVLSLKSADGWMRKGRILRPGMQAIKMAKARASTIRKKRELEMRREEEGEVTVGMYAEWQTELYRPPPIVNGKIPTNDFGNIDLYVPTMLPEGAVYIPHKGCAKVARKLGISFAEAVTGFEFRKRQAATPIIKGIVIASENEQVFLEALASHNCAEERKEAAKQRERVLRHWSRLVQGLRIVLRINEQYSHTGGNHPNLNSDMVGDGVESEEPGGFLDDLKDVVRPYNLPMAQSIVPKMAVDDDKDEGVVEDPALPNPLPNVLGILSHGHSPDPLGHAEHETQTHESEAMIARAKDAAHIGPPLTMQQLADHLARSRADSDSKLDDMPPEEAAAQLPDEPAQIGGSRRSKDQRAGKYDGDVGPTRGLRRSQRQKVEPPNPVVPVSTRTLRPRKKI